MKHILTFLLILAVFALAYTIAPALTSPTGLVVADEGPEVEELPSFRIYTKAECSNVSDFISCYLTGTS